MMDFFEIACQITRAHAARVGAKPMMSPERELEARANPEAPDCAACGHGAHVGTCEYEPGDRWMTGNQPGEPTVLVALPPCGCEHYIPESFDEETI